MSLHTLAKNMAAHGRGPDTMLVHMAPSEVAELQQRAEAHGGSLTINPHTGLAEAGFLKKVGLGFVEKPLAKITSSPIGALALGAALGPAGWAAMSSLGAAATVGGLATLSTGSLKQGVMSGLGAYSGANLYSGLVNAGAQSSTNAALTNQSAAETSRLAATAGEQAVADQTAAETARLGLQQEVTAQQIAQQQAQQELAQKAADTSVTAALSSPELAYQGATDVVTTKGGLDALAANMPQGTSLMTNASMAAAPFLAEAAQEAVPENNLDEVETSPSFIRPYQLQRNVRADGDLGTEYEEGQDTSQRRWFDDAWTEGTPYEAPGPEYKKMADGGPIQFPYGESVIRMAEGGLNEDGRTNTLNNFSRRLMASGFAGKNAINPANNPESAPPSDGIQGAMKSILKNVPRTIINAVGNKASGAEPVTIRPYTLERTMRTYDDGMGANYPVGRDSQQRRWFDDTWTAATPYQEDVKKMAAGGLGSLGGYSDGGRMLKGPGDGMSDSIPAQIGGKQPARLADGEFVVPADVVSHLGNGSTDAGAKQLYKMMDRIRQARTGKKKQAPAVKTGRLLPA
jgi:hypothetical protein